jgi:hypothetical protein
VKGTVLQVDSRNHVMRLVSSPSKVGSYRYRGRLKNVRPGSVVRLDVRGHRASRVRSVGRTRRLQVKGRVVQASNGAATFSLPDGRPLSLSRRSLTRSSANSLAASAQNVFISFEGLKPGQSVLITITFDASGDLHISIKLLDEGGSGDEGNQPNECGDPSARAGAVVGVNQTDGVFTISRPWGEEPQTYQASAEQLTHIHLGDDVLVRFDPSSSQASDVKIVRSEFVAPDPGVLAADGTVNSVNGDAGQVTVIKSNRSGRLVLNAPCWILNQVWASEDVHVVYHSEPNGDTVADTVDANDGTEFERR